MSFRRENRTLAPSSEQAAEEDFAELTREIEAALRAPPRDPLAPLSDRELAEIALALDAAFGTSIGNSKTVETLKTQNGQGDRKTQNGQNSAPAPELAESKSVLSAQSLSRDPPFDEDAAPIVGIPPTNPSSSSTNHEINPSLTTTHESDLEPQPIPEPKPSNLMALIRETIASGKYLSKNHNPHALPKASPDDSVVHRVHRQWRTLSALDKIIRIHGTMKTEVAQNPDLSHSDFTANLGYDFERKLLDDPDPGDALHRKIAPVLKRFGAEFWFIPEFADVDSDAERARRLTKGLPGDRRLHVHGEILAPYWVSEAICEAMAKALGEWPKPSSEYQIQIKTSPDMGWVRYTSKQGADYRCTARIRKLAETEYERDRVVMNRLRRARK